MLFVVTIVIGGIILTVLLGVGLMLVFSSSSKGKNTADELSISAAKTLNSEDRQGRINILTERSRELVFSSRKTYQILTQKYRHLEPLGREWMEQARHGAELVDAERNAIEAAIQTDLTACLNAEEKRLSEKNALNLGGFKAQTPRMMACEVGILKDSDSNVFAPNEYEELKTLDLSNNLINKQSNLYRSNINAKLPAPDDDLKFKFSSLPAPIKGTIPGARLITDDKFHEFVKVDVPTKNVKFQGSIPSAIRMKIGTQLNASGAGDLSGNVASSSVALTDGGTPAPDEIDEKNQNL